MRAGLRAQLAAMPGAPTLKEALLAALVEGKGFDDYVAGDPDAWGEAQARPLTREDWTLIESVTGDYIRDREAGAARDAGGVYRGGGDRA